MAVARPPGAGGFTWWMFISAQTGRPNCAPALDTLCINALESASFIESLELSVIARSLIHLYNTSERGVSIEDKLNEPFFEVSPDWLEYDDDLADDFDSFLPEEPSVADCERIARQFGGMSLIRNSKSAERIIKDVQDYRIEKRIRKHILHILKSSDGVVSMSELMRRINDVDGQAGANASVSLIYVMQAEGEVKIDFQKQLLNFTLFGQQHKFYDQNIVVKLLHKH